MNSVFSQVPGWTGGPDRWTEAEQKKKFWGRRRRRCWIAKHEFEDFSFFPAHLFALPFSILTSCPCLSHSLPSLSQAPRPSLSALVLLSRAVVRVTWTLTQPALASLTLYRATPASPQAPLALSALVLLCQPCNSGPEATPTSAHPSALVLPFARTPKNTGHGA